MAEAAVAGPALDGAPAGVQGVEVPAGEKPAGRVIAPLKWGVGAVEVAGDGDDRTPLERLTDGDVSRETMRDSSGRFKAPDTEPVEGAPEVAQVFEFEGQKFSSAADRDNFIKRQVGRVSAADKRANELAKQNEVLADRVRKQGEVLKQFEEYVARMNPDGEPGKASRSTQATPGNGGPDLEAAAHAAGVPESLIDAVDWDVVQRFGSDPQLGVAYAIAAALKSAESVWAAREKRLVESLESKFKPDLGFVSEIRQAQEGAQATADFIKGQSEETFRNGSPRFPELHGDSTAVREFVARIVPMLDEMGDFGQTPRGFETAVLAIRGLNRGKEGAGASRGTVREPIDFEAHRAAASVGGGSGGPSVGPAAERLTPSAEISRRIRAANDRTPTGWKFA